MAYLEKEEARLAQSQNKQNPLNIIDCKSHPFIPHNLRPAVAVAVPVIDTVGLDSSPEFAAKVKDLCHLLGIIEHPDPVVSLKVR